MAAAQVLAPRPRSSLAALAHLGYRSRSSPHPGKGGNWSAVGMGLGDLLGGLPLFMSCHPSLAPKNRLLGAGRDIHEGELV